MEAHTTRIREKATFVEGYYRILQQVIAERNDLILKAYQDGVPQSDLAAASGLSQQRISQLVYDDSEDTNGKPH